MRHFITVLSLCCYLCSSLFANSTKVYENFEGVSNDLQGTTEEDKVNGILYKGHQSAAGGHDGGAVVTSVLNGKIRTRVTSAQQTKGQITWDSSGLPERELSYVEIILPSTTINNFSYQFSKENGASTSGYIWTQARALVGTTWEPLFNPIYKASNGFGPWQAVQSTPPKTITKVRIYAWANGASNPGNVFLDNIRINSIGMAESFTGVTNDLIGEDVTDKINGILFEGYQADSGAHSGGTIVTSVTNNEIKTKATANTNGGLSWDVAGLPSKQLTYLEITLPPSSDINTFSYKIRKSKSGFLWTQARALVGATWEPLFDPLLRDTYATSQWSAQQTSETKIASKIRIYTWANGGMNPGDVFFDDITINVGVSPSNLVVSTKTDNSLTFSWDSMTGAKLYHILVDGNDDFSSTEVDVIVPKETTTYQATGLETGTNYYYKVAAYYSYGDSPYASGSTTTSFDAGITDSKQYWIKNKWNYDNRWTIDSVVSTGAKSNISNNPNNVNDWYVNQTSNFTIEAISDSSFNLTIKTSDSWAGGKAWVDWNHDGIFDDSTEVAGYFLDDNGNPESSYYKFDSVLPSGGNTITITVPDTAALPALPFTTRIRVKAVDVGNLQPANLLPDQNRIGQAHDYGLTIIAPPSSNYLTVTPNTSTPIAGVANNLTLTAKNSGSTSTLTSFTGAHDVRISGVKEAPDGTYGTFNGISLTSVSALTATDSGQVISVSFSNGIATVPLVLNHAGSNDIKFEIKDLVSVGSYELAQGGSPDVVHGERDDIKFMTNLNSTNNYNGGVFIPQPVIKLVDRFLNICTTDSVTQITALKNAPNDPNLIGSQTVTTSNGIATFTNLGNMNLTKNTIFNLSVKFVNETLGYEIISNELSVKGSAAKSGKCVELSGSEYGDLGSHSYLDAKNMGSVTVETWVYINSLPSTRMCIIGSDDTTSYPGVNFGIDSDGKLFFKAKFQGSNQNLDGTSTDSVPFSEWVHVAFSYNNETKDFSFYINAEETGTLSVNASSDNIWPKRIRYVGKSVFDSITNFTGRIDELRIWNIARTAQELENNKYELTSTTRSSSSQPIAYYRFDTYTGKFASDYSSNSAPLEIINFTNDTLWADSNFKLTPVLGFESSVKGSTLTWAIEEEIGVKKYVIKDSSGEIITTVIADGSSSYNIELPEGITDVVIEIVDNDGSSQTYAPEDGNKQITFYDLEKGWNLIAITADNADLTELKKSSSGAIWAWNGESYTSVESAEATNAVWVYMNSAKQVKVTGTKSNATIKLSSGWNLVGPTENGHIPEKAISTYSWDSINEMYQNINKDSILQEGIGYWIFSF